MLVFLTFSLSIGLVLMNIFEFSFLGTLFPVLFITVGLSLAGLFISKKIIKITPLKGDEISIGTTICTIIGALFGLILALMVINLWQDYKNMHAKTIEEATYINIIYREANNLQPELEKELKKMLENYISIVINESWPLMTKGIESKKALLAYDELDNYVLNLRIKDNDIGQEALKSDLIKDVNQLALFRKERLFYASTPRVPSTIWLVIILGAIISISSTYFFRIGSLRTQVIFTSMHSGMVAIIIFLIMALNYPFRGAIKIEPYAFIKTLDSVKNNP